MSDSSSYSELFKGKFIDARYIILKLIDYGSYGSVWVSYDIKDLLYCAIKITKEGEYAVGKKEAQIYKKISECKSDYLMNIKRNFDFINDENDVKHHCSVMEIMGCSLYKLIR